MRLYCAAVFAAGCASVALLARTAHFGFIARSPLTFAILSGGVLLGEMLPVKIPRRDNEEITLSVSFAMVLLLVGGLGPALVAQGVASLVQDIGSRKPAWRARFNIGQYTLSMVAAYAVVRSVSASAGLGSSNPFASRALPAMLLGATAFLLVNTGLVGVAVSLFQRVPILRYLRTSLPFVVITGGLMLAVAPVVLAAAAYSVVVVPLCLSPVVALYYSISRGARSEHAARHDALTGLPNRTAFNDAVIEAVADENSPAAILLMDLDRFKEINDTLGHRYGDLLLEQVAQRVRARIGDDAQVARLGGDEFAIVGVDRGYEDAIDLARAVLDCVNAPFELEEMVVDVQASVGIALFPEHGSMVEMLVQKADVAMYRAKENRSDWAIYDERHDHDSASKRVLTAELRTAVRDEEIVVYYQPELDLHTGKVCAVEALVRWEHPTRGVLPPSAFLRLAEQTNMIAPLTHRVIGLALAQLADWLTLGLDLSVAVNIAPQVLVNRSFTAHVVGALGHAGVSPSRLKLEVTEGALMSDPVVARAVLHELDALGIEISIDDFGTGYSSLAYLADLPVSEVKIDRSFVSRMGEGSREKIIVTSTIDLAHNLGMRAVAEGVEQRTLLPELKAAGCDAAQGYGIGRPMAARDATRWLLDSKGPVGREPRPHTVVATDFAPTAAPRRARERAIGLAA